MNPRLVTSVLIPLLLLTSLTLGLIFGGGFGGSSGGSAPQASTAAPNPPSAHFMVVAERAQAPTGVPSSTSGNGSYEVVPMGGLSLTLTKIGAPERPGRGGPVTYKVVTNSSGELFTVVPGGNYTVTAGGTGFNLTRVLEFTVNFTTFLRMEVVPVVSGISSVEFLNQDTVSTVEPNSTVLVKVAGNFSYTAGSSAQLAGWAPSYNQTGSAGWVFGSVLQQSVVTCSVMTEYMGVDGTWVVMKPTSYFQPLPTVEDVLIQYQANSTVSYVAG